MELSARSGFERRAFAVRDNSQLSVSFFFTRRTVRKIRDQPSEGEIPMCNSVLAIIEQSLDKTLSGLPVAVAQQAPKPPILIEGYKRSLAALWKDDSDTIEIYLCDPCPAFVSSAIAENE
jgi:hypothetical protein